MRSAPVVPYDARHKAFCPWCESLQTIYVPALAEGHCDACGRSWRFLADPTALGIPAVKPRSVDYSDLLGFAILARRKGWGWDEARDRYRRLGIPAVADETWERAWRQARDFA